jgi:hypothetical protein
VTTNRLLTAATVAWLAAVAAFELGGTAPSDIGASPDAVADGEVWRLLTSSLLVDAGLPALQVALLAGASAAVIRRAGPRVWWVAALVGHVMSALLAYASIGVAIALGSDSADRVADDWDFGVSCVLAAQTGVLFADALGRIRRGGGVTPAVDVALLAITSAALLLWLATISWYGVEHPLAFALGAAILVAARRRRSR